ncbi:MAG: T9SS type A sorting domain-containing protein [Bacteroides sp.]|nr:T9SS type A sorting domain-containing protein [Bacteroides sp.]
MQKLLLLLFLSFTSLSYPTLWAQDDGIKGAMTGEQPASQVVISVTGSQVRVQHAQPGALLDVYSILGVKVASIRIESTDDTIRLELQKGFYILKVGNVARKVVIR